MAVRSDVTVDWSTSPRLLTVAAPSTEITVQEIVDTCRYLENLPEGMLHQGLIDAAGKEPLGGLTSVGITATLQNAQIAFEARGGPSWVLCIISGGNVVAVDDVGGIIDPRYPTAFTTVDRTASSSATLQEQEAIQYSSYGGGVSLDPGSSHSGTSYPVGNLEYPVNNLADAISIASEKGFRVVYLLDSMTLESETVSEFRFIGRSRVLTEVTISPSLVCDGSVFSDCRITGTLDGGNSLEDCIVGDINYVNGEMRNCGLTGTVTLGGGANAILVNCVQSESTFPTIDMGASGQNLSVTQYSGVLNVKNLSSPGNVVAIGLDAGTVTLESTITAGQIIIGGVGTLIDESTSCTFLSTDGLLSRETITKTNWDKVFVNDGGASGTTFPQGTIQFPVDNLADAKIIADANGIEIFHVHGQFSLTGDWSGYTFEADSYKGCTLTCSGATVEDTIFQNLGLDGSVSSGEMTCYNVVFASGFTNICANMENCQLTGAFTVQAGKHVKGDTCTGVAGASFDLSGTGTLQLANFSGVLTLSNCTSSTSLIGVTGYYVLTLSSSVTAGQVLLSGIGVVNNSSTPTAIVDRTIPVATWESLVTSQGRPDGSAGQVLENIPLLIAQSQSL